MPGPRVWFDEEGRPLHECNECGVLIPIYNEICFTCYREEEAEWDFDYNSGCWSYSW